MEHEELMPVNEFCRYYNAEFSFVNSLYEYGLIEITTIENAAFINKNQLQELEKFVRLHYDMDINLEGIEAINHLLQRLNAMQIEIKKLKSRVEFYREEE